MINQDYKYTNIYKTIGNLALEPDSLYIYSYSTEERSHAVDELRETYGTKVTFLYIDVLDTDEIQDSSENRYNLRHSREITKLISSGMKSKVVYLDVTGIGNRISAALLNNLLTIQNDIDLRVVYAEPAHYKVEKFKSEGVFHDLSEEIDGIAPLPGFANIIPDDTNVFFVALLGFEGGRFSYIMENIDISKDNIYPIIGVPGYRPEYPFVAYWGNSRPLKVTDSWRNVKYAAANSLVDVFLLLTKLKTTFGENAKMKLAPIGTKPHAIAAILFAIKNRDWVELLYDNPKRKTQRTTGVGLIVETNVSKLLNDN